LQTAFYLNSTHKAFAVTDDSTGKILGMNNKSEFSVSNEWKLNLLNPSVKAFGLGLYGEVTLAPHEYELEYKLLLDKRNDKNIISFNHVGEFEYEYEYEFDSTDAKGKIEVKKEFKLEHDLGYMRLIKPNFGIGLEARHKSVIEDGELEHAVLFGGLSLFYSHTQENGTGYFLIFAPQWQITDLAGDYKGRLNFHDYEKIQARVLMGITF
jgi:hypothetical protein